MQFQSSILALTLTTTTLVAAQPTMAPVASSGSLLGVFPTDLQPNTNSRCGVNELDARGNCGIECTTNAECGEGEFCWGVFLNYCHIMPEGHPNCDISQGENFQLRCGFDEYSARGYCGDVCTSEVDCPPAQKCFPVNLNLCTCFEEQDAALTGGIAGPNGDLTNAEYFDEAILVIAPYFGSAAPISAAQPAMAPVAPSGSLLGVLPTDLQPNTNSRCGVNELDARGNCGIECTTNEECGEGEFCWGVFLNYCHIMPEGHPNCDISQGENFQLRCGFDEYSARGYCGDVCTSEVDCPPAQKCFPVNLNLCTCFEEQDAALTGGIAGPNGDLTNAEYFDEAILVIAPYFGSAAPISTTTVPVMAPVPSGETYAPATSAPIIGKGLSGKGSSGKGGTMSMASMMGKGGKKKSTDSNHDTKEAHKIMKSGKKGGKKGKSGSRY